MKLDIDFSAGTTMGPKQSAIVNLLDARGPASLRDIKQSCGQCSGSLKSLLGRGIVESRRDHGVLYFSLKNTKVVRKIADRVAEVRGLGNNGGVVIAGVPVWNPDANLSLT